MSTQQLLSQTDIAQLPSTKEDKQKIQGAIREIADSLIRKKAETDLITEIADGLKEEHGLSKRLVNSLAKAFLEGDFDEKLATLNEQVEEFEEFYTEVMK